MAKRDHLLPEVRTDKNGVPSVRYVKPQQAAIWNTVPMPAPRQALPQPPPMVPPQVPAQQFPSQQLPQQQMPQQPVPKPIIPGGVPEQSQ